MDGFAVCEDEIKDREINIENGRQGYIHQILLPTLVKRNTCRALD